MERHPTPLELSRYLDRVCSEGRLRQIGEHLDGCRSCGEQLETLRVADDALKQLPQPVIPDRYGDRFRSRLLALKQRQASSWLSQVVLGCREAVEWFRWQVAAPRAALAVVAALLLVVGGMRYTRWLSSPVLVAWNGRVEVSDRTGDRWRSAEPLVRLASGSRLRVGEGESCDLVRSDQYRMRCEGPAELEVVATSVWRRSTTVFALRQGRCLVETDPGFRSRQLQIRTPSAVATVVGTGFGLAVNPDDGSTWLGVAHGTVQFGMIEEVAGAERLAVSRGYAAIAGTSSGQMSSRMLSDVEWVRLQQLDEVGWWRVRLDLGDGPQRVERLFGPARLYIHGGEPLRGYRLLERVVEQMNRAFEWRNERLHRIALGTLEALVVRYQDPRTTPELMLFTGAYYASLKMYPEATATFDRLLIGYPDSEWISLALCAKAIVAERSGQSDLAIRLYHKLLQRFPDSSEAITATAYLNDFAAR